MAIYLHGAPDGYEVVQLERWSIRRFRNGAMHFVGFCCTNRDGRVSTEIVDLDAPSRTGFTASGRHYQLLGPSGFDGDAEYVWGLVAGAMGAGESWQDVTEELIPGCRDKGARCK
ncbi:hypothetical protein OKW30_003708 [Paraburkholderia sp. Clong3]|uniref:hypothetical protein n=1 Tax=Paraburkholderia sp. Clong3 TaxID=2991061 RepID=UPI003D1EA98A